MSLNESKIGWCFDNSYAQLPEMMASKLNPTPVKIPKLIVFNDLLSNDLGLNFSEVDDKNLASIFAGNLLPSGSKSIAQAYAGHQFGYFTMLGDGRAILIGEHITKQNNRFDIQLKGSGKTPYSRGGDGRAALGPVLREYIISECMYFLGIPTTRSLAAVTTGEKVMRERELPGAILTRVASSHIRVGTFQYIAMRGEKNLLKNFHNYVIERHYPEIKKGRGSAVLLLRCLIKKQIELVINWMRVGFIHGVMNTDNMSISGETIDYGPCAFMDVYSPKTVFSSIDHQGRYSFGNQPNITHWNLSRFAESLLPLINDKQDKAIEIAKEVINEFPDMFKSSWFKMMGKKLGLLDQKKEDEKLINGLLSWMERKGVDYTNTFRALSDKNIFINKLFLDDEFKVWYQGWKKRIDKNTKTKNFSVQLMKSTNPSFIPRNFKVEEVLKEAVDNKNLEPMSKFLNILKKPYDDQPDAISYKNPPARHNEKYKTFCGT